MPDDDACVANNGQNHRFFLFKTYDAFVPSVTIEDGQPTTDVAYYKREVAILSCNCGEVIKTIVRQIP